MRRKASRAPMSTRLWSRKWTMAARIEAITSDSRGNHTLVTSWALATMADVPADRPVLNRFQASSPDRKNSP